MKRLYRLKVYCVENLLVEEQAVYEVLRETLVDLDTPEIKRGFRFDKLLMDVEGVLFALWRLYAVVFDLRADVETISYSVHRFRQAGEDGTSISPRLVRQRMKSIVSTVYDRMGKRRYLVVRRSLRKRWATRELRGIDTISGKHCVFPLLYQRCKIYGGYRDTEASLKVRLARHCDVKREIGLYRALRREIRNTLK